MTNDHVSIPSATAPAGVPDGWRANPVTAFDALVGPIYLQDRTVQDGSGPASCGFLADGRHANRRGVVHGGAICTAFDVALGLAGRPSDASYQQATLHLSVQFVSGMMLGEFAVIRSEISRATRSVTFLRGVMDVDGRIVATAEAIFKRLRPPTE